MSLYLFSSAALDSWKYCPHLEV